MVALRLFEPNIPEQPEATLEAAFRTLLYPSLESRARASETIAEYRRALESWGNYEAWLAESGVEWFQSSDAKPGAPSESLGKSPQFTKLTAQIANNHRSANPGVCFRVGQINAKRLVDFRTWLIAFKAATSKRPFGPRSANKAVGAIATILKRCADFGEDHLAIAKAPKVEPLPARVAAPKFYLRFLTMDETVRLRAIESSPSHRVEADAIKANCELSRLWEACAVADWPTIEAPMIRFTRRHVDPVKQWRAAIVCLTLYGMRTQDLLAFEREATPLTWLNIVGDKQSPSVDGRGLNDAGWLFYTPRKTRRAKAEPLVLPMHPIALAHFDAIRAFDPPPSQPIFNWPFSPKNLYRTWANIVEAANIAKKRDLANGAAITVKIQSLRKTCASWHNHFERGIAGLITGHAARGDSLGGAVVSKHYDNAELSLINHFQRLPIPHAWQAIQATPRESQLRLFE